jgi:hypothetical protein
MGRMKMETKVITAISPYFGINRDVRIGDLLPPADGAIVQSAVITVYNQAFVTVEVRYVPVKKGPK